MDDSKMEILVRRLDRVERENRRWKRVGTFVLAAIAAVALTGQATPRNVAKEVEAEKFLLRDTSGKTRAVLAMGADESVGLSLSDKDGTARIWLSLGAGGSPVLALFDKTARPRATVRVWPDGLPHLALTDKDGKVIWKAP
ncbi:MAG: hypothetical protein ACE5I9_04930 [Candidatus Methylomirabilales bacterium]